MKKWVKSIKNLIFKGFFGFYHVARHVWALLGGPKKVCSFYPSCSQYAKEAFQILPWYKALFFSFWRILRCHPWRSGTIDYPPGHKNNVDFSV